jgi:cold shock CspA family protein
MESPVHIDFEGISSTPQWREAISHHVRELESRHGRITAGRVVVKGPGQHHREGGPNEIHIHLSLPNGREVNVRRINHGDERFADPIFALNDAFKRARRQLQDQRRRMGGDVKRHEATPSGTVVRIDADRGFGFLVTADNREVYFHRNSVLNGAFDHLTPGTAVSFAEEMGIEGPQASTVYVRRKRSAR